MLKNIRNITLLFVLLMGVLSNVFATSLVHDASQKSIEKSVVGYESIKAWEAMILSPQRRVNIPLLENMAEVLDPVNANALASLGGEAGYFDIIRKNPHAPLNTSSHPYLKSIDIYAKQVLDFAKEFGTPPAVTGFDDVVAAMKNGNFYTAESVAQMLKEISSNPSFYNKNTVTAFDGTFATIADDAADLSCANCRFDMIANGVKIEFKSVGQSPYISGLPSNTAFHNQHRAYLESQPPLQYIFEAGKIQGANGLSAEQYVRKQFLEMYKQNAEYFLTDNSKAFWKAIDNSIEVEDDLLRLLNNSSENSPWLNFIQVK